MNNETAKKQIEALGELQKQGDQFPCPRCGRQMHSRLVYNALSRHADVYVCERCGMDEALNAATGRPPLPFEDWAMITEEDDSE